MRRRFWVGAGAVTGQSRRAFNPGIVQRATRPAAGRSPSPLWCGAGFDAIIAAMQTIATVFWRRLDAPGHDACRLERHGESWQLDGAAVFRHTDGRPARLDYRVFCDKAWHTKWGRVRGWIGDVAIDFAIGRNPRGDWTLNDEVVPELGHCIDLDLGFTPATNLVQLRRVHLDKGESAKVAAVWVDLDGDSLSALVQHYERKGNGDYAYHAPRFDYKDTLKVDAEGFVTHYPGLWELVA
jgi:hypothetical protein